MLRIDRIIGFYKNILITYKHWFYTVLKWFILAFIGGVITFFIRPDFLQAIVSSFAERFGENPNLDFHLVWQIFLQNLSISLLALFGGVVLGLGSFFVIVVNGFLIGFVVASLFVLGEDFIFSLAAVLGGLLPHGIFELPAFFLAGAVGLRLGIDWLSTQARGQRKRIFKKDFIHSLMVIPVIALALFIASIIEVFVSGKIVDNL